MLGVLKLMTIFTKLHERNEAQQREAEAGQRPAVGRRQRGQIVGELVEPICAGHRIAFWRMWLGLLDRAWCMR